MNVSAALSSFLTVRSADADTRRRGSNLIILALGMAALALAFAPFSLGMPNANIALALIGVSTVTFISVAFMGRAGFVTQGAWIMIGVIELAILAAVATNDPTTSGAATPFYLVLAILLASVLLPPVHIWTALVIALVGLALVTGIGGDGAGITGELRRSVTNSALMLSMVAVISFVSARGTLAALREAQAARTEAELASRGLSAANANLEHRVEERTAALRQIAEDQRTIAAELKASLQAQQDLNRIVAELSVPVIPVSDRTLVVPLVGNIDSARAEQVLTSVLATVETRRARTVVLDVTGVALVDTHVAGALLRVAQATRLMGADTVLAGIRPEVAQSLVGLGVDLRDLHTVATLQEAL